MNKYKEAIDTLIKSDIPFFVYKGQTEDMEAPRIFDFYHSEIFTLRELVDKATPKKPIGKYTQYKCPVCGRRVRSGKGSSSHIRDNVCQRCYQVLDWGDEE